MKRRSIVGARHVAPLCPESQTSVGVRELKGRDMSRPYGRGLAYRAFAVTFLLLGAAHVVTAADFSHKAHLVLKGLECASCHSAAPKSSTAKDNLLPATAICESCHDGGSAPYVDWKGKPAAPRTFEFNHEFHLAMGNVAPLIAAAIDDGKYLGYPRGERAHLDTDTNCIACHRGLHESDQVDSSLHLPAMSDCLVCHDQIDNPFTCEKCHGDVDLRPADHTREFVDQHSTRKLGFDKVTCQPCHGREFRCMGCH